ncbi:hypothetical protein MKO06_04415 [Gramella sp. GC03-9]|uniref:Secreted protein n=1 Tax=Christiangramia oceanisediminis TaxID=2920386 RepID=A0A9X2KWC1_9FLAO|nr:hypothetical protein [Gramella oceanisediminis]MCP9199139.1 hypothetical protein [Gramella oceanisediminis]
MKKLNTISAIILILVSSLVLSCKDEPKSEEQQESAAQTTSSEDMKQNMAKSSDLKYNPAHGEEGHRCDLPVGAPLDQPKASQQQDMTISPVRLKSAMPKINPPHGEPGHDCSVPVGAELKG